MSEAHGNDAGSPSPKEKHSVAYRLKHHMEIRKAACQKIKDWHNKNELLFDMIEGMVFRVAENLQKLVAKSDGNIQLVFDHLQVRSALDSKYTGEIFSLQKPSAAFQNPIDFPSSFDNFKKILINAEDIQYTNAIKAQEISDFVQVSVFNELKSDIDSINKEIYETFALISGEKPVVWAGRKKYHSLYQEFGLIYNVAISEMNQDNNALNDDLYNRQLMYLQHVALVQKHLGNIIVLVLQYWEKIKKVEEQKIGLITKAIEGYRQKYKGFLSESGQKPKDLVPVINATTMITDYLNIEQILSPEDLAKIIEFKHVNEQITQEDIKAFLQQKNDVETNTLKDMVLKETYAIRLQETEQGYMEIPVLLICTVDKNLIIIDNPDKLKSATYIVSPRYIQARLQLGILEIQEIRPGFMKNDVTSFKFMFPDLEEASKIVPLLLP